jgi:multidrug efflux system outer membrane protein
MQYDGGYAPYMTVIQAQEQLFPAELDYARYRASLFSSFVAIYKALGGACRARSNGPAGRQRRRQR